MHERVYRSEVFPFRDERGGPQIRAQSKVIDGTKGKDLVHILNEIVV